MTKGLAAVKATLEAEGIEFTNNAGLFETPLRDASSC